ncbi:MAG: rhodanese-like domain-containing protein [Thermosynechococcaceae cyanobacterium]
MTTATHHLQDITPLLLKQWMDQHKALLLDVREPKEFAQEHIPGAKLMPLSNFDPAKISQPTTQRVVLQCQSGRRSAQAAQKMFEAGFTQATHLQGGLLAWKAAGFSTDIGNPSHRLFPILVGSLILLSTSLGPMISPWLLILSTVVGGSLILVGVNKR